MTGYATPAAPLRALVAELVAAGVRDAVVCPGSRSMPMALALRAHPELHVWMHLDERAAAYFALGLARASRRVVAVLGTSGTAAVNFAPAVVEASLGRVALLLLTADRPPELRDRGAPQTIDQDHLYGRYTRWYAELPVPEAGPVPEALIRDTVDRAVATALQVPAGPVQLNLPFRAPLLPDGPLSPGSFVPATTRRRVIAGVLVPRVEDLSDITARVRASRRPTIVVGPMDVPGAPDAIARLAATIEAPILADGLSNMRLGGHDRSRLVARPEMLLRSEGFRANHRPDLIIRFGGTPTSAATLAFLETAPQVVVDEACWNDPSLAGGTLIQADPVAVASEVADRVTDAAADGSWLERWRDTGARVDAAMRGQLAGIHEPFEESVFAELAGCLPAGSLVHVGSSMPVRDLDMFLTDGDIEVRFVANRGANGIDGVVSSALGAAAADRGPLLLVVGDVSFVHDLNALMVARQHGLCATVVVLDNDGGGIFSFLPQGAAVRPEIGLPAHYEELFGTPHGLDLLAIGRELGAETADLEPGSVGTVIRESMGRPGVRLLRLRTERGRNVELHRRITDAALEAVA